MSWYDDLPKPISSPPPLSIEEVHDHLSVETSGTRLLVVDVRRADIEVCVHDVKGHTLNPFSRP